MLSSKAKSSGIHQLKIGTFTFVLCCLLLSGCGDGHHLGRVSGTVTYDGKPASGLVLNFVPEGGGRTSGGSTDSGGKFQLIFNPQNAGALVGKHKVKIDVQGKLARSLANSSVPVIIFKEVEVLAGSNEFDLKLEEFTPVPN